MGNFHLIFHIVGCWKFLGEAKKKEVGTRRSIPLIPLVSCSRKNVNKTPVMKRLIMISPLCMHVEGALRNPKLDQNPLFFESYSNLLGWGCTEVDLGRFRNPLICPQRTFQEGDLEIFHNSRWWKTYFYIQIILFLVFKIHWRSENLKGLYEYEEMPLRKEM